ncbi:MAG: Nif3-like dinuclear metal center hexameric protein [Candidatus Cloacimonetes bacterium]|nr:Nif3-like dinuclear metal center hexameric protein [Candidatus Cloacimonadota bacterium]
MIIADIVSRLEVFAPQGLALGWDNVGLQIGEKSWEVSKVLVTLDVTSTAIDKAIENGAKLIVSHHPLIFQAVKSITNPSIIKLIQHKVAVICLHTNYDVAKQSVNHALAKQLGLEVVATLSEETGAKNHHITVFCPPSSVTAVSEAAWKAGAGNIGNYSNCATQHEVKGFFKAESGAKPYTIAAEETGIAETALDFICDSFRLHSVLAAIRRAHPYETPLVYNHSIDFANPSYGLGLVCKFNPAKTLGEIAHIVKTTLKCPQLKLWTADTEIDSVIDTIAICGGSGGSLLKTAEEKAQLFISGDISYHSFLDSRIPLIDAGHFYTEYPALEKLNSLMDELGLDSSVLPIQQHEYCRKMQIL